MSARLRAAALPVAAVLLVSGVLAVQVANGGGTFVPLRPADACVARTVTSQAEGIDGLTERLVLLGVADAACRLGVSRESLTLDLAQPGERSDAEVDALREGLRDAVRQLADEGSLPPASELVDEALDNSDLNRFLELAIRALPDSVVDAALKTDDVLDPSDRRPRPPQPPREPGRPGRPRPAGRGRGHRGRPGRAARPAPQPPVSAGALPGGVRARPSGP